MHMGKMSKKERRLKIFLYGSKAIAKYLNGDASRYYCPICGVGYLESSAITGNDLTLEDVPPKSIDGKPIVLTCRKCNSSAGHTIDVATASKRKLEDSAKIISGQEKGTVPFVTISFGDINLNAEISSEYSYNVKPLQNANAPEILEKYKDHLKSLSSNKVDKFQFNMSISEKYDHRYFKLSHLKSAFLLVFAWLGYRYALDKRLEVVRQQIQEPEKEILGAKFWLEGNESMPSKKILLLENPLPVLLVSFDGFSIILPSLESTGDIYKALPNYWEKGQRITLEAKVLLNSWPDKLQMKLDYRE